MAIAIGLLLVVSSAFITAGSYVSRYQDAIEAGHALRLVKKAQLDFLADNPTLSVANLTGPNYTAFLNYLPNQQLPSLPKWEGSQPTIRVTEFPPVAVGGSGVITYGQPNDGLWDAGR